MKRQTYCTHIFLAGRAWAVYRTACRRSVAVEAFPASRPKLLFFLRLPLVTTRGFTRTIGHLRGRSWSQFLLRVCYLVVARFAHDPHASYVVACLATKRLLYYVVHRGHIASVLRRFVPGICSQTAPCGNVPGWTIMKAAFEMSQYSSCPLNRSIEFQLAP